MLQELFTIEFVKTCCERVLKSCDLDLRLLTFRCIPAGKASEVYQVDTRGCTGSMILFTFRRPENFYHVMSFVQNKMDGCYANMATTCWKLEEATTNDGNTREILVLTSLAGCQWKSDI